uniref:Uncharacterized protein n=1 Tax=Acrobeloides nanus TaxID=290746 RepID=A0A914DZR6_9BILA
MAKILNIRTDLTEIGDELECADAHYGFVMSTNSSYQADKIWCVNCNKMVQDLEDAVNSNEFKQMDWIYLSKTDNGYSCRLAKAQFQLRMRNNRIEAETPFVHFNVGIDFDKVGHSPPFGRVGIFFHHTMPSEIYHMVWASFVDEELVGPLQDAAQKYNVRWVISKSDKPVKLNISEFLGLRDDNWEKFLEYGVIVKKEPMVAFVWHNLHGICYFKPQNIVGHCPNVGEGVGGVFIQDNDGRWHLCNATPIKVRFQGIYPFDIPLTNDTSDAILLQVDFEKFQKVENSHPTVYTIAGFTTSDDEYCVLDNYKGQFISKVVIKWNEESRSFMIVHVLKETTLVGEVGSTIMLMYACVVAENERKIVMMANSHPARSYRFLCGRSLFHEPPEVGEWYQIYVKLNMKKPIIPDLFNEDNLPPIPFYTTIIRVNPCGGYRNCAS